MGGVLLSDGVQDTLPANMAFWGLEFESLRKW